MLIDTFKVNQLSLPRHGHSFLLLIFVASQTDDARDAAFTYSSPSDGENKTVRIL